MAPQADTDTCQSGYFQNWQDLHDPHVRALAWLLGAPGLLDPQAPRWHGQIASIGVDAGVRDWLHAVDAAPAALHAYMDTVVQRRLGRYAENLLAFYFREHGCLLAHGLQVKQADGITVGEFDFLLHTPAGVEHWECATKFYLLTRRAGVAADYFVGPNLADTLGAKMDKVFLRQLRLAWHPAAQACLPAPVARAKAFITGWLFYHWQDTPSILDGVAPGHCRGSWYALHDWEACPGEYFAPLPRLSWMAPAQMAPEAVLTRAAMGDYLRTYFSSERMPLLLARLECGAGRARESARAFIVPDDWAGLYPS